MTHDRITMAAKLFAAFMFSISVAATAQQNEEEILIESQALGSALQVLAEEYELQLLFESAVVTNLTAQAIPQGASSGAALDGLLEGTDLTYQFVNERTVAIREKEVVEESSEGKALPASSQVLMAQNQTSAAQSQSSPTSQSSNDEDEAEVELENIIVTGSRIRGAQSASPVVTITRAEIDQAGFATVEEVVEHLPQNFGAGATLDATNFTNKLQAVGGATRDFAGGTSVNLRGLGSSSTLVLLNGRRMSASGFTASFTSISSIPVSAIERVEVMTDGASAIYGSDAIGGVVNFILRESYEGAETRLRYGTDTGGDTSNVLFGQSFGKSWDSGNVLLTYEYYDSEALAAGDREFTASNDLSEFGGTDRRQPGGNPANIQIGPFFGPGGFVPPVFYAIPTGQDGTALTPADFIGLENTQHFYNAQSNIDTIPEVERHSSFLHLRQAVGSVELFGSARFSSEKRALRDAQDVFDFRNIPGDDPTTPGVIEGNPWFVDPTGTGLSTVTVDNYTLFDDLGPSYDLGELESSGATLGAQFEFSENWRGELLGNWSKEEALQDSGNFVDSAALTAAVSQSDPDLAFNPFGDGSNTNSSILEPLVGRRFISLSENELWSVSLNVDGDAFEFGGGAAKIATGVDFREESLSTIAGVGEDRLDRSRDILAVYGELFVPIVSKANSRKGLQRLEVSLAARYEDYSDFGDDISPKLGVLWSPTESLAFRGTIGTSYRAPSLVDLDDSLTSWRYFPDALGLPFSILIINGRNSDLQAEEATTWTAGFQWTPEFVDGLSLDVTYFNVDFTDRIETPAIGGAFPAATDPRFASFRIDNPTSDQIATVANDPIYNPDWAVDFGLPAFPVADLLSGALPVGAIVDNRLTNLAQSVVTGAEVQLSYAFDTDVGLFYVGLNGSYMFDFERKLLSAEPLVDEVDTIGRPVDLRARGNVGWSRNRWSVTGFVNYTDGYTDNVSSPERNVDSWTTVDLTIAYETGNDAGFLSDTRLSLTIQNLFDEDPPFVDTFGGVGYDATNANPLGQFFSLQITKDW